MMFKVFFTLSLLVYSSNALHITIGKEDCIGSCVNYYKAGADAVGVIQEAFNKVRSAGKGKITIKEGVYILSRNVDMYSNTELVGEGMDKTILKLQDYALPWKRRRSTRAGFLRSVYRSENKCENLVVAHLTLDGNKKNQNTDDDSVYGRYGYFTEGCANVLLDSVRIENFQGYGFDPHGWKKAPGGPLYGTNLKIVNCVANDNDWDGFTLDQTNGMNIKNNTAINNGRHGFNVVTGSFNVYIEEAYTYFNGYYYYKNTTGCGITIQNNMQYGTNAVVVVNSTLVKDSKGGVCSNDVFDVKINQVHIITRRQCFRFTNSRDFMVTNNLCNHTQIFNEVNVTNIFKSNNSVGVVDSETRYNMTYHYLVADTDTSAVDEDNIEADENKDVCPSGVFNKSVCCLSICGTCGGNQCGSRPGGSSNCCTTQILASNRHCENFDPPCIL